MPVTEPTCTGGRRQFRHDAKFQEHGYAAARPAGNLNVGPSTPLDPWCRIGRVTDHRVLVGKRVASLLFGLVGTVLAVASCGSDFDGGWQPDGAAGGTRSGVGGAGG